MQNGREAKHSGFEVSPVSWLDSVTSSQWVMEQEAILSEPQFSWGTLRGLKEIRQIKQVFVST